MGSVFLFTPIVFGVAVNRLVHLVWVTSVYASEWWQNILQVLYFKAPFGCTYFVVILFFLSYFYLFVFISYPVLSTACRDD